jgi:hypothetical protein
VQQLPDVKLVTKIVTPTPRDAVCQPPTQPRTYYAQSTEEGLACTTNLKIEEPERHGGWNSEFRDIHWSLVMLTILAQGVATATAPPNKIAMSRALGAAFLNHQVEQLEKSVGNGPTSGNWRDRERGLDSRQGHTPGVLYNTTTGAKPKPKKKHVAEVNSEKKDKREKGRDGRLSGEGRRSSEGTRKGEKEKDADVVVVDASVLVHALYQVKKWCRDGRNEVLIVPLEGALRCFCLQFKLPMTDP